MTTHGAAGRLEHVARTLEERGDLELAREVAEIGAELRGETMAEPTGGVLTTGEAAALLGIRSVNTVKRWAREGLLEGYRRGGRVLVSRRSVERMLAQPAVATERAAQDELDAALAPFDAGDARLPETRWSGRKPWARGVGTRS